MATRLGAADTSTPPPTYDTSGGHSHALVPGTFGALPWESANLTSNIDGQSIYVSWSRPDTTEPVPILLDASPYLGTSIELSQTLVPFLRDEFEPHGYAVGGIAVRGTSWSGGCMDMMGPEEKADIDQAITWLATRAWSNGNVALYGSSYEGSTPWEAASTGNPHVKAIVPMNGIPSLHDLMFHNGTAHSVNGPIISGTYYAESTAEPALDAWDPTTSLAPGTATRAACQSSLEGLAASQHATLTGADDPVGYWDAREHRPDVLQSYHGAIFSVMGLQDWNVDPHAQIPFAQEMQDQGHAIDVRQMYHNGGHWWPDLAAEGPATMRWDWAQILLEWLDEHLKDGPAWTTGHVVDVQSPDGRWWALDSFPPRNVTRDVLQLGASGLADAPGAPGSTLLTPQGWHGDRFTDAVGTMPELPGSNYQADITFPGETTISGLARLHATVTPTGPGGDLTAWLYDVAPDGTATRVTWAQMDLAYADGGTTRHVVEPGQPIVAMMQFEPQHFVLEPGHALRLRVWEYSAAEYLPGLVVTPIALDYGAGQESTLDLPVVPNGAPFVPPGTVGAPRTTSASYQTTPAPTTATFAVQAGETSLGVMVVDSAIPASGNFHLCQDANGDGVCGGAGELDTWYCYQGTFPIQPAGDVQVTVYANSHVLPAGVQSACDFPTALATASGTVHATFYQG